MSRPRFEVADIIRQFGVSFANQHHPNTFHLRVLNALSLCRTAALGGHTEQCDDCGHIRISYNSCGNRHCPKCQAARQAEWVDDLMGRILPVKHFHIVFTVPQELNSICMLDSAAFYNLLFDAVWGTLRTFGYTRFGVESGAVCVLHTWGQNLSLHPHIHCIVPAAGFSLAGNMKHIAGSGKYLYPVTQLSAVFRGKLMELLKRSLIKQNCLAENKPLIELAWAKPWVVFCEPSLGKPEHVIRYLGLYSHRVAISNHRIIDMNDDNVTFSLKDYADQGRRKTLTLSGTEFLRRFCLHILPHRFVKIRYYGIYSSRFRAKNKHPVLKPKMPAPQALLQATGVDVLLCPVCKKGRMVTTEVIPRIRSPNTVPYFRQAFIS